jgi:hypothetical protein
MHTLSKRSAKVRRDAKKAAWYGSVLQKRVAREALRSSSAESKGGCVLLKQLCRGSVFAVQKWQGVKRRGARFYGPAYGAQTESSEERNET